MNSFDTVDCRNLLQISRHLSNNPNTLKYFKLLLATKLKGNSSKYPFLDDDQPLNPEQQPIISIMYDKNPIINDYLFNEEYNLAFG